MGEYSEIVAAGATLEEQARGAGDRWMEILRERPQLLSPADRVLVLRDPRTTAPGALGRALRRAPLGKRSGGLRGGGALGPLSGAAEAGERLGLFITALGNGLALEKLVDPDAVPDSLYGELLALVFRAFEALLREDRRPSDV